MNNLSELNAPCSVTWPSTTIQKGSLISRILGRSEVTKEGIVRLLPCARDTALCTRVFIAFSQVEMIGGGQ